MLRSVIERQAVAAFAFIAAASWLGVGLVHGLLCLFVSLVALQAVRIYQRRNDARVRATARRRKHARSRRERPGHARPGLYDGGDDDLAWTAAGDAAW